MYYLQLATLTILLYAQVNAQTFGKFFACYLSGDTTGRSSWCGNNNPTDLEILKNPQAIQQGFQNTLAYHNRMVWNPQTFLQNPTESELRQPQLPPSNLSPSPYTPPVVSYVQPQTLEPVQPLQPQPGNPQITNSDGIPVTNTLIKSDIERVNDDITSMENSEIERIVAEKKLENGNDVAYGKPLLVSSEPNNSDGLSSLGNMQINQNEDDIPLEPSENGKAKQLLPINTIPYSRSVNTPVRAKSIPYGTPNPELGEFHQAQKILDSPADALLTRSDDDEENKLPSHNNRKLNKTVKSLKQTKLPNKFQRVTRIK
uniref:Secreted protein n=1 Tax=Syphacia muris TaxID=451379 RepID=A0A0N5AHE4_9BILA